LVLAIRRIYPRITPELGVSRRLELGHTKSRLTESALFFSGPCPPPMAGFFFEGPRPPLPNSPRRFLARGYTPGRRGKNESATRAESGRGMCRPVVPRVFMTFKLPADHFALKRRLDDPSTGSGMCEKCVEIDEKVEHYRSLAARVLDGAMIKGIEALIADLLALKKKLHPAQEE